MLLEKEMNSFLQKCRKRNEFFFNVVFAVFHIYVSLKIHRVKKQLAT